MWQPLGQVLHQLQRELELICVNTDVTELQFFQIGHLFQNPNILGRYLLNVPVRFELRQSLKYFLRELPHACGREKKKSFEMGKLF